jgi:hydroxymethylpyrimidine kinase/phosphomethylpyrimidine kinase
MGSGMMPRVLTVAGSDSGGGAGIQADLKTIALLGGFGMSAITALTAQNTQGVIGIQEVPAEFVALQMEAVLGDIGIDAMKTGMMCNAEIIQSVCRKIRQYAISRIVVDPVMVSKHGTRLLSPEAEIVLQRQLLPLAEVCTPNLPECEVLTGKKIKTLQAMRAAAKEIHKRGARNVLVKGGHLPGPPIDIFFDGRKFFSLEGKRIATPHSHGTGCTLSAAIALELARGHSPRVAVQRAKSFIELAIRSSLPLGHGQGPVNPYAPAFRDAERYRVIEALKRAFQNLQRRSIGPLCPEVQSNLGYALPDARTMEDVAAFPGRFVRIGDEILKAADPQFGASRHIARIILTAMLHDPHMRSAMNLRFSQEILSRARKEGFRIGHFDRKGEPLRVKRKEDASLSWGVNQVLSKSKKFPDLIFDRGGLGKEPMIRLLGRDPEAVTAKALRLL